MKTKGKLNYDYVPHHGNYLVVATAVDNIAHTIEIALLNDELLAQSFAEALNEEENAANLRLSVEDVDMSTLRVRYIDDVMQIFSMSVTNSRDNLRLKGIYPSDVEFMSKDVEERLLAEQERKKNIH